MLGRKIRHSYILKDLFPIKFPRMILSQSWDKNDNRFHQFKKFINSLMYVYTNFPQLF